MKPTRLLLQWSGQPHPRRRTGISLHSHTLHSKESLDFIYRAAPHSALLRFVLRRGEARFQAHHGVPMDLRRGWWTPPLAPLDAQAVEERQIEALDLEPIVSLTDHDDIEAPMSLQAVEPGREVPLSTEWTVPFRGTFFHFGIHHLPARQARPVMSELTAFTASPEEARLAPLLEWIHQMPGTLIVLNHPLWDESGVGRAAHRESLTDLIRQHREFIHALEVNGLRPWSENRHVLPLGQEWGLPVVSGGDRHALEPNANINLTNARTFAEFSTEVREGCSEILMMNQYRLNHAYRIFHNLLDVLRPHGSRRWEDRVFYQGADGVPRALGELWAGGHPRAVRAFTGIVRALGSRPLREALRQTLPAEESSS